MGPCDTRSTRTSFIRYPSFGWMVNVWLLPALALIHPAGEIVPCRPATALMIKVPCVAACASVKKDIDKKNNTIERKFFAR